MRSVFVACLLAFAACSLPPAGSINPAERQVTYAARATRGEVLAALNVAASELGLTVADANAEAGFWRTSRYRIPVSVASLFTPTMDVELSATLEGVAPDSVRVTVTGLQTFPNERPQFAGPYPITRNMGALWSYVDSLAAKAARKSR